MRIKPLASGKSIADNNVFIAPMAGYTDHAVRSLLIKLGAGLTFTELVSAKGLFYGAKGTKELLYAGEDNSDKAFAKEELKKTAAQIFGADPYYMRCACESEDLKKFDIVDINMGCPVPKVYKNGEGSALLNDIKRAGEIVKECVKSGKTITVKIRTGIVRGDDVAAEFAKMAEDCGASLVTVHGRVREAYYSGEPDYEAIRRAKNSVGIPVIANGGIFTEKDADETIERTGADGVMLARGAIADPFLVAKLTGTPYDITLKDFVIAQLSEMLNRYGDKRATAEFRKFVPYYIKGGENAKAERVALMKCESVKETASLIERFL